MIWMIWIQHGSLNVPIEHHPTIRYMVYNGYYKVMFNIPKMGQLPTPVETLAKLERFGKHSDHGRDKKSLICRPLHALPPNPCAVARSTPHPCTMRGFWRTCGRSGPSDWGAILGIKGHLKLKPGVSNNLFCAFTLEYSAGCKSGWNVGPSKMLSSRPMRKIQILLRFWLKLSSAFF